MNLLIVPGTTQVAYEVLRSLSHAKDIRVFGAGYDLGKSKTNIYTSYDYLPQINLNSFEEITSVISRKEIDLVYFAHDEWLYFFRSYSKIGNAQILSNHEASLEIVSFKSLTYSKFSPFMEVPITYRKMEDIDNFPVFLKPDRGQGSNGARIIKSANELEFCLVNDQFSKEWIVCEYLPGPEYTIDCFSDLDSNLIFISQRERCAVMGGKAVETKVVEISKQFYGWARKISKVLSLKGAWFFQAKIAENNRPKLLEIGLRIAGASGINRLKGVNLSLLNYYLYTEKNSKVMVISQSNTPRLDRGKFDLGFKFEEIFVDLDDTLVVNGARNQILVDFLVQKYNECKKIRLITRRSTEIDRILDIAGIKEILEEVIQVPDNHAKSAYIPYGTRFLFIDDSFRERKDVKCVHAERSLVLDPSFNFQG
jgi:hypothetical protein